MWCKGTQKKQSVQWIEELSSWLIWLILSLLVTYFTRSYILLFNFLQVLAGMINFVETKFCAIERRAEVAALSNVGSSDDAYRHRELHCVQHSLHHLPEPFGVALRAPVRSRALRSYHRFRKILLFCVFSVFCVRFHCQAVVGTAPLSPWEGPGVRL